MHKRLNAVDAASSSPAACSPPRLPTCIPCRGDLEDLIDDAERSGEFGGAGRREVRPACCAVLRALPGGPPLDRLPGLPGCQPQPSKCLCCPPPRKASASTRSARSSACAQLSGTARALSEQAPSLPLAAPPPNPCSRCRTARCEGSTATAGAACSCCPQARSGASFAKRSFRCSGRCSDRCSMQAGQERAPPFVDAAWRHPAPRCVHSTD